MNYDRILIRYGEISTKGRNRHKFVEKLRKSIKSALISFPKIKIEAGRDRTYILLNGEDGFEIVKILTKVFGIQSLSPAVKVERDLDKIKTAAKELFSNLYKENQTFKITYLGSAGRRLLRDDLSFPLGVAGPRDLAPLAREAAICLSEGMGKVLRS